MAVYLQDSTIVWGTFSISGILKVAAHNFMKSRSHDGLAARGLLHESCLCDNKSVVLSNNQHTYTLRVVLLNNQWI